MGLLARCQATLGLPTGPRASNPPSSAPRGGPAQTPPTTPATPALSNPLTTAHSAVFPCPMPTHCCSCSPLAAAPGVHPQALTSAAAQRVAFVVARLAPGVLTRLDGPEEPGGRPQRASAESEAGRAGGKERGGGRGEADRDQAAVPSALGPRGTEMAAVWGEALAGMLSRWDLGNCAPGSPLIRHATGLLRLGDLKAAVADPAQAELTLHALVCLLLRQAARDGA
ncbi:hypothetical protein PAPYR_6828 [Paratrimastix pyriformis]|uniref:Uncharacterized protein n=1 Tax=Paratrimastix pyriformis TaxID=342808 RepID=A0ABQ8UJQ8_9EUKA|nr:hypothetical protein PAPYR_6828 [Paratrimastix pyriformis]